MWYVSTIAHTPAGIALGIPTAQAGSAEQHRLLPRALATWNPRGCLVAVLEEPAQAALAALALRNAGFGVADVCLVTPRQFAMILDAQAARGRLARIATALRTPGDEGLVAAEYADAARRGRHLLIVYAPGNEQVHCAHGLLADHGAHTMYHFGRWIVRGL